MICEEKMRLIAAHAAATERFAVAATRLRLTTHEEFNEALAASKAARAQCVKARRAIEKHRDQHCCYNGPLPDLGSAQHTPGHSEPVRSSSLSVIYGRATGATVHAWSYTSSSVEVYKSETQEIIKRFLNRRLSFHECLAALDAALADLTPRLTDEQIASLRPLVLENNDIVMKEMERRSPPPFDPKILDALGDGITVSAYRPGQVVYAQGDCGDAVFYIQKGRVKLTVVSKFGKQAVIGILGAGSFFGEGCLRGLPHAATATAVGKSSIERLERSSVIRALGENLAFAELFLGHLLSRNLRMEQDMVYEILNSHEKRLARALLMLADFGKKSRPKKVIPKVSFEALADMVGTTISRVGVFMRKFRKLGFIDYNGKLKIYNSLLNVVLHDKLVAMATDPPSVMMSARRTPGRRVK
jgi:CRP/FNR family cyclic AMP-dependent transcriptional regulator